ncbi:MAG: hypothetical protein QM776_12690 [Rhodocyclaceae bacterium]
MSRKTNRPRNLVHLALLRTTRNAVHGKTAKQQRSGQRVAMHRRLKDEGVCAQHALSAF